MSTGSTGCEGVVTVDGGATRAESVANALAAVETEYVAIHDAARPLLTAELLDDLVAALAADPEADAIIAAAPVTDTVKKVRAKFRVAESTQNCDTRRRRHARSARALGGADASGLPDGGAARARSRSTRRSATPPPTRRC